MRKKILAMLLAVVMVTALLPTAFAADGASGTCGENLTWTYSDGVLTIEGTGSMEDYMDADFPGPGATPWDVYRKEIQTVIIGDGVTSIGWFAFYFCSNMTSITIPTSVTHIGTAAFGDHIGLTDIYYGGSASQWQRVSFYNIDAINKSELDAIVHYNSTGPEPEAPKATASGNCGETSPNAFQSGNSVTWTLIDDVLTIEGTGNMDNYPYGGMVSVKHQPWDLYQEQIHTVIIGDGVTSIGNGAFSGCYNLTGVTIPDSVTAIGNGAFYRCYNLTGVTLPDNVTAIGNDAFSSCTSLTGLTIPDGVTSIGYFAFNGCTSLTSITIPNGVTAIETNVFYGCTSLTNVTILDGLTSIEASAFNGCASLTSITIPNSVTEIGGKAFSGCDGLTDVYYGGSEAQWKEISGVWIDMNVGGIREFTFADDNGQELAGLAGATIHFNSAGPDATTPTEPTEPETPALPTKFTDVPAGEYYTSAVAWAVDSGIAKGTSGKKFSPAQTCTEAQILTMLWRAEGKPTAEASNITVASAYQKAVDWAYAKGMINDSFDPNADCDRATAVYYIWMAKGQEVATAKSFKDVDPDADYADAVSWAVAHGIAKGTGGKKFSPKQTCERGMIVTFLYRAYK